jgi:hypothetical protein
MYTYTVMERVIRPWVDVVSYPRVVVVPPIEILPEVFLQWGGPSQFVVEGSESFREVAKTPGLTLGDDDDDDEEELIFTYNESGRNTSEKRIENPDDPDQYVMVEVIDEITFDHPTQKAKVVFKLNNSG